MKLSIYLPTKYGKSKVDASYYNSFVKSKLLYIYGGYTAVKGRGSDGVCGEPVEVIWVYTSLRKYIFTRIALRSLLIWCGLRTYQRQMLYSRNNKPVFIKIQN